MRKDFKKIFLKTVTEDKAIIDYYGVESDQLKLSVKDLFQVSGTKTTGGSWPMREHWSIFTADVIEALKPMFRIRSKDNLDEMGVGQSGESNLFGKVNFKNLDIGGSSTGTALNIFKERADLGIGTDTGGSIRDVVHDLKGIWGFKPTYGLVSRWGLLSHSNPLDTVSFLSKRVRNIFEALLLTLKYRENDLSLIKIERLPVIERRFKEKAFLLKGGIKLRKRIVKIPTINPTWISRCYFFWSSIYLYSNLQRFYNKAFTGYRWLFKPCFEAPRWGLPVRNRYLLGQAYLNIGWSDSICGKRMIYLKNFYSRLMKIATWKWDLRSKVRTVDAESDRNWSLILANLAGLPSLSFGNDNYFEEKMHDLKLLWRFAKHER